MIRPQLEVSNLDFCMMEVAPSESALSAHEKGDIWEQSDPRLHHIVKWLLSVGESVSFADVNNDGYQDLFLSNMMKKKSERAQLYLSNGKFSFAKFPLPSLDKIRGQPKSFGFITNGIFVDYDNDGDQDIFLSVAFGQNILLQNELVETGKLQFTDKTLVSGLDTYSISVGASFADFNKDGKLDLFVYNVLPSELSGYEQPTRFNIFNLPQPQYEGDERMFNFMHDSWHISNNGGQNFIYLQNEDGFFQKMLTKNWLLSETRWSLAVGLADLNNDGWVDIYVANDFGPDDLYFNLAGKGFKNHKGQMFGSIGRDTYKGMNVSIADFSRRNWPGVYVSNVHHPLQAEGSLLWSFYPQENGELPQIVEEASRRGALNERRFGWGATASDFDNNGWVDLAQANGMVDDHYDKLYEQCPDYWYINEKIARSAPHIHRYANKWGDIRGYCIFGKEKNRLYLNHGSAKSFNFIDVANQVGLTKETNSRGAASVDIDNNGRRDIMFSHLYHAPSFYRNRPMPKNANRWIGFDIKSQSAECNREAIGTKVTIYVDRENGDQWSISQEKQVVSGFSSQSDKENSLRPRQRCRAGGCQYSLVWEKKNKIFKTQNGTISQVSVPMKNLTDIDGDLKNNWYILVLEKEVKKSPIRRILYDKAYVIYRTGSDRISVAEDKCIHRGTKLSEGKVVDNCIQCPYHGWSFDHRGHLTQIPSQGSNVLNGQRQWKLSTPPTFIQDNCIWIWCGNKEPKTPAPPWRFPNSGKAKWSHYFMVTDFDNEVTHLTQNFMDVPHTVFVHDKWFRRAKNLQVPMTISAGEGRVKVTYDEGNDQIGFFSRMLNPTKKPMIHTDEFIFPNITRVDYIFGNHAFIINSQCSPVSRYKTRVYTWIAFKTGLMTPVLKPFLSWYTKQVILQDVTIMKNQGSNLMYWDSHQEMDNGKESFKSTTVDEMHIAIQRIREKGTQSEADARGLKFTKERAFWI